MSEFISRRAAARQLGCTWKRLQRQLDHGHLQAFEVKGRVVLKQEDVDEFELPPLTPPDGWITRTEAVAILRSYPGKVNALVADGTLEAMESDGRVFVRKSDVRAYAEPKPLNQEKDQ
ncbi:DNA-binding protein [Tsukamurella tyrosinosolvens]|uniref:DNA-binding protein n=1 Tax=Tsukamurella tyrosinosolvens TaxID=57704 RepID=UPI000CA20DE1|nr:DNA-binding protein [Tsukamurella tyrosinosolvens]AUN38651.1 hypothetical protein ASU32_00360 [Tsukamurella tyrosinosolvens]